MAITNVVASGTAAASSADIAIAAGAIYTFMLNPATGIVVQTDQSAHILQKTTTGYIHFGSMDYSSPNAQARGPITVQIRKQGVSVMAFGVDQDA